MKNSLDPHYALFCSLMTEEHLYYDSTLGFDDLCRIIGADPRSLDRTIAGELGMSGPDYMALLRKQTPARLYQKYGIKTDLYCKNCYIVNPNTPENTNLK